MERVSRAAAFLWAVHLSAFGPLCPLEGCRDPGAVGLGLWAVPALSLALAEHIEGSPQCWISLWGHQSLPHCPRGLMHSCLGPGLLRPCLQLVSTAATADWGCGPEAVPGGPFVLSQRSLSRSGLT